MVELPYRLTPVEDDPWAGAVNPLSDEELERQRQIAAVRAEDKPASIYPGVTGTVMGLPLRSALGTATGIKDILTGKTGSEAIRSAGELQRTGQYDPAAPLDVALSALGIAAPFAEPGALGIFGGRVGAHNLADRGYPQPKAALNAAEAAEARGFGPDAAAVFGNKELEGTPFSNVHKGADGQWRFEMPDDRAKAKLSPPEAQEKPALSSLLGRNVVPGGDLGKVVKHPYVYDAYPGIAKTEASISQGRTSGSFYPPKELGGRARIDVTGKDVPTRTSTALHEIQHNIQDIEGFAIGGNASLNHPLIRQQVDEVQGQARAKAKALDDDAYKWADAEIAAGRGPSQVRNMSGGGRQLSPREGLVIDYYANNPDLMNRRFLAGKMADQSAREDLAFGIYKRLAGETEARNVQTRRTFTPEQRSSMRPAATQQYPPEAQIVVTQPQGLLPLRQAEETAPRRNIPTAQGAVTRGHNMPPELIEAGERARISPRHAQGTKATEDPLGMPRLRIGLDEMKADPNYAHNAELVKLYGNLRPEEMKGTPDQVTRAYIDHVKSNLLWLYDHPDIAPWRERAQRWYEGANRIADHLANTYGMHPNSAAGLLAAFSPQKDWFENVSLAYRAADIHHNQQNTKTTPEMLKQARKIFVTDRINAGLEPQPERLASFRKLKDKTYGELTNADDRAMWVRMYDQSHLDSAHHVITPEGYAGEKASDNTRWQKYSVIGNALRMIDAKGDLSKISPLLGDGHKVRSFYNNIIAPWSPSGDVTMDTHAIAAGHLRPYGSNDMAVTHNFGSSMSTKDQPDNYMAPRFAMGTGVSGNYGLNAQAYREAAAERGVLPRELQSATWEAVRSLFPQSLKGNKGLAAQKAIADAWSKYQSGVQSLDETRAQILKAAGGKIRPPKWHNPNKPPKEAP